VFVGLRLAQALARSVADMQDANGVGRAVSVRVRQMIQNTVRAGSPTIQQLKHVNIRKKVVLRRERTAARQHLRLFGELVQRLFYTS
jgi:hypothetical protein